MSNLEVRPNYRPYRQGLLTEILDSILESDLPKMLQDPEIWDGMLISYAAPTVRRLWTKHREFRLNLHEIRPCSMPYKHIHPWPSAIKVISGTHEMEVGTLPTLQSVVPENTEPGATVTMKSGSTYEMTNPLGWHSVRPLRCPSLSIMLTGEPWFTENPFEGKGKGTPLHSITKTEILESFQGVFVW
jgi:hypothetical protein